MQRCIFYEVIVMKELQNLIEWLKIRIEVLLWYKEEFYHDEKH